MDLDKFLITVRALPLFDKLAWGAVLLAILAAIALVLFLERRHFKLQNRAGSWLALRLWAFLVILPVTIGALVIPAVSISGPEALAYFYLALFSLAPLLWFGGHVLCGRLLNPAFSRGESLFLGFSGLLIMFIPVVAMSAAQGPIFFASREVQDSAFRRAASMPLAHGVKAPRRFTMPGVGIVNTQSLIAPPGIRIERIDQRFGEGWYDTKGSTQTTFCRDGQDLHLMWSEREPPPVLRIFWRQLDGQRGQADFATAQAALSAAAPEPFAIAFRDDGFDPPVPIPRSRASVAYFGGGDRLYFNMLNPLQPGETFDNDCIKLGYKRVAAEKEGPPQVVALMFHLPGGAAPLRAEIARPANLAGQ